MKFIVSLVTLVLVFLFLKSFLMAIVMAVLAFRFPDYYLTKKVESRRTSFDMQMIDATDILAGSIKSGQTISQSFQTLVTHMPAPISQEFGIVLTVQRLGDNMEDALRRVSERMQSKNLDLIISSILIAERTGGNLIETFQTIASSVRQISQLENRIRTATSQERMQGNVLSMLPIVLMIGLFILNRPMVVPLFTHPVGMLILAVIVLFEMIGIVLIRQMINRAV